MACLRRFATYTLILWALVFSASVVMGADDFMVLRYSDGSTQNIKLDRPSDSIRQIEFVEGKRMSGGGDRGEHIKVISATYGGNCGAPYGNATSDLAAVCDGKGSCEYVIDVRVLGDPAKGCHKDYVAEWQCGRDPERSTVGVRAGAGLGEPIVLKCPIGRRRGNDRY